MNLTKLFQQIEAIAEYLNMPMKGKLKDVPTLLIKEEDWENLKRDYIKSGSLKNSKKNI